MSPASKCWGPSMAERYQIISPLNHGSFGMVSLARDSFTGRSVALKCQPKVEHDDLGGVRINGHGQPDELSIHARLGNHPNVVQLLDSFETETHKWLVLEYCQMGDLYEIIQARRGPTGTADVRRFMFQLLDAVSHMHAHSVFHRDIKPENIFLNHNGVVKIGDFGLATTQRYAYDSCVGSDRYMAPEQYDSEGAGYDPERADIWSIGICLLNVLFRRNPFSRPCASDPLFADFIKDRKSLFDIFPLMSEATYEVLLHCLDLDPRRRSLTGLRRALKKVDTFTVEGEMFEDLATPSVDVQALSETCDPIHTPSLDRQEAVQDSYPWIKPAVDHSTRPKPQSYSDLTFEMDTEDLFESPTKSSKNDHGSDAAFTPSLSSVWDTNLGSSYKSFALDDTLKNTGGKRTAPLPIATSASSQRNHIGSYQDRVPKSWSDIWDDEHEDVSEEDSGITVHAQTLPQGGLAIRELTLTKPRSLDCLRERAAFNESPKRRRGNQRTTRRAQQEDRKGSTYGVKPTAIEINRRPVEPSALHHHLQARQKSMTNADIMAKWADLGNRRRATNEHGEYICVARERCDLPER